ncbi:hypothetical protein BX600DRAFT_83044 [Xylariales sp. PMI_506]|nr:hypothetical protein BX600DRAFT_83044 [Xylariales sp. PMI_506]
MIRPCRDNLYKRIRRHSYAQLNDNDDASPISYKRPKVQHDRQACFQIPSSSKIACDMEATGNGILAKFEEWPLYNVFLRRVMENTQATFQLRFVWGAGVEHTSQNLLGGQHDEEERMACLDQLRQNLGSVSNALETPQLSLATHDLAPDLSPVSSTYGARTQERIENQEVRNTSSSMAVVSPTVSRSERKEWRLDDTILKSTKENGQDVFQLQFTWDLEMKHTGNPSMGSQCGRRGQRKPTPKRRRYRRPDNIMLRIDRLLQFRRVRHHKIEIQV